jgi:3-oxoacyl-[acyl-carrier-protein] synthase II
VSWRTAGWSTIGSQADRVAVGGSKGYDGHALGATGAIEAAVTALAVHCGWIPPTLNLEEPDLECILPYVQRPGEKRAIDSAISNSFGFGGINAALVFGSSTLAKSVARTGSRA